MKMATIREFRNTMSEFMESHEPVMITRHGKPTGFYVPWDEPKNLPLEIKRELFGKISPELSEKLSAVDEKAMLKDFNEWRKTRRRRR